MKYKIGQGVYAWNTGYGIVIDCDEREDFFGWDDLHLGYEYKVLIGRYTMWLVEEELCSID